MNYYFKNADEQSKRSVWSKGKAIPGYDSNVWRRDVCGKPMKYSDHGKTNKHGWEIDHIKPTAKGGSDYFSNLQPLHWSHNRAKADKYPWRCEL